MRRAGVGRASFRGCLVAGVFAAATLSGVASAQQAVAWSKRDNCGVRDLSLPAASRLAEMARECDAAGADRKAGLDKLANAAYNAARAYNAVGESGSGESSAQAHAAALDRIGKSLLLIPNDDSGLASGNKNEKLINDRFKLGRAYERARAMVGLGVPPKAGVTPGPCSASSREGCFNEAIMVMAESESLAAPFSNPPPDTRYDDFIFLRGKANARLGGNNARAIADLEKVVDDWTRTNQSQRASEANKILAEVTLNAGDAAAADKTVSGQTAAVGFYEKAVRADPNAFKANLNLGDANSWLGESTTVAASKTSYYSAANTAYGRAVAASAEASVQDRARAFEGQGRSLLALSVIPNNPSAQANRSAAIAAYNQSIQLQPNSAAPRLALARAYLNSKQLKDADKAYEEAIRLMQANNPNDPATAVVLIELADQVKKPLGASPEEVRAVFNRAKAGAKSSARPDYEIGLTYVRENNLAKAEDSLKEAVRIAGGLNNPPAAGETDVKASAFYNLSLVQAQRGNLASAVINADAAARVGANKPPYRDHACLAHIVAGDKAVTATESASVCADTEQPQNLLMLGMFHLRKAQSAAYSAQTKASTREMAIFTFNTGLKDLSRPGLPPEQAQVQFSWPGMPSASAPSLKNLLEYGKAIAAGCSSTISVQVPLSEQEQAAAMSFYKAYKAFDCK
jgi:tetratricopeptide (TPR) repeat protein